MLGVAALLLAGAAPSRRSAGRECDGDRIRWNLAGLQPPCDVLAGVLPAARAETLARAYQLDLAQARCVAEALDPSSRGDGGADGPWRRCLDRWPASLVPLLGREGLLDAKLIDALLQQPEGLEVAERLLAAFSASEATLELARRVVAARPGRLRAVLALPAVEGRNRLRLAAPLMEAAPTRTPPFTSEELAALGESVLSGALDEGYLRHAANVWRQLPSEARERLRARPLAPPRSWVYTGVLEPDGGSTTRREPFSLWSRPDLRETLALALAAAGDLEEARRVPVAAPGPLLRCLLGASRPEPLELAMALGAGGIPVTPQEELAAALTCVAPEEALVAWSARYSLAWQADLTLPPAMEASRREALRPLRAAVDRLPAPPPEPPLPSGWPRPSPWVERGWPWAGPPGCQPAALLPVPGLDAAQAQLCQGQRVTLAARRGSHAGPPGLWLVVGTAPVYLGPLEAGASSSPVPLLDRQGVVRLPVRRADGSSVVLEAPLAALRRDTDGDGLSDLVEDALLLDPRSRDTDGDGTPDGVDRTPRLDDRLPATAEAEVLGVILRDGFFAPDPDDLVGGPHEGGVHFLRAELAASLMGLRPPGVLVQVTEREVEAGERYGGWGPLHRVDLQLSSDGGHALAWEGDGIHTRRLRVDRQPDGGWVVKELFSWVW